MAGPSSFAPVSGEWASGGFDVPVAAALPPPKPAEPVIPKPLAVVLPFIEREREQVLRLIDWILKLSGKPLSRTLYLVPFKGLKIDDVLAAARETFADVKVIADSEGATSDWKKGDKVRDAAGPNSLFRQAAWWFHLHRELGPWLWMEPDCVPLSAGWSEALETAYRASGKPFLGARMKFAAGDYLNGAAVYPRDAVVRAPSLVSRATWTEFPDFEAAFDVAGGAEVLRQATLTDLIALPALGEPRKEAVLFHGDRDGELLQKLLSGVPVLAEEPKRKIMAAHVPTRDTANGTKARGSTGKRRENSEPRGAAQKSKTQRGQKVSRQPHKLKNPGSNPGAATNGHEPFVPTIGDHIRYHVSALISLASNANRTTRVRAKLLRELRKAKLVRR